MLELLARTLLAIALMVLTGLVRGVLVVHGEGFQLPVSFYISVSINDK